MIQAAAFIYVMMWAGFILNALGSTIWIALILYGYPMSLPETILAGSCMFFTYYCGRKVYEQS